MARHAKRIPFQDRALNVCLYVLLSLFVLICAYPVYFVLLASFSDSTYVNSGELLLWVKGFHVVGYQLVFADARIVSGYLNTILYTVGGTALGLATCMMAGYALARRDLPGRKVIMKVFVFTMYFGGGLIPLYIVLRQLGLIDTRFVMILLGSVSVYNIILIRTFIMGNIPQELQDAAFIDGCGNTRFFFQFVLPLSTAIIAVIGLYNAVGYWNSYFNAMVFINSDNKKPLQLWLRYILASTQAQQTMFQDQELIGQQQRMTMVTKYAMIVISTAPIMCAYPFVQKYFVKGVMVGSLKG